MLRVLLTPSFSRAVKKLNERDKRLVDDVVRQLQRDPQMGDPKRGDLAGTRVFKFKLNRQENLLAYWVAPTESAAEEIHLLALGAHDFYRDLKSR